MGHIRENSIKDLRLQPTCKLAYHGRRYKDSGMRDKGQFISYNNISQSINIFALVPRTPVPTRQGEKGPLTLAQAVGCVTQEET